MTIDSQRIKGRPVSDVSSGVGLAGLFGLFFWIAVCRNWASIADVFGIPGPRMPMSGPNAAVMTIFMAGIPMVLWSVLVDKVHLRASTGIDWSRRAPLASTIRISLTKIAGLWSTWAIIGFFYCIARWYWDGNYHFAMQVIGWASIPMVALSVPYVVWLDRRLVNPRDGAWHFGAFLIGREAYDFDEIKAHFRSWAVKGFFTAFMISILPGGFAYVVSLDLNGIPKDPVRISGALIELLFLIDVHIAMVGYLLTIKPLDSHIRSANPYLAGWVAALICYPPFILMGDGSPLGYHYSTAEWSFWMADYPTLMWAWGALLVFLTAIYAWATVAFGLRFSNLTYRGIITNGPYRFTRHPAYLSKNLFWWCATMPFLVVNHSVVDAIRNTTILALVSAVYFWRAKTEEKHLLGEDTKYREYHAWMAENALITRTFGRIGRLVTQRGPQPKTQLGPAE